MVDVETACSTASSAEIGDPSTRVWRAKPAARRPFHDGRPASICARIASSRSSRSPRPAACPADRLMRGNRIATRICAGWNAAVPRTRPQAPASPALCTTSRHRSERSIVLRRTNRSICNNSSSVKPKIGFATGTSSSPRRRGSNPECVIRIKRRALAAAALGIHQHRVDDERIALPFPPRPSAGRGLRRVRPLSMRPSTRQHRRRPGAPDPPRAISLPGANATSGERSIGIVEPRDEALSGCRWQKESWRRFSVFGSRCSAQVSRIGHQFGVTSSG